MQSAKKNGLAINDVEASIVLITDSFKGIEQPHQIIAYRSARGFHVSVIGAHVDFGVSSSVEAYSVPYGTMLRSSDYQIPIEHISYLTAPDSKGMLAGTVSSKVVKAKADLYKCESMAALGEDKDIRALYNDNYFFEDTCLNGRQADSAGNVHCFQHRLCGFIQLLIKNCHRCCLLSQNWIRESINV